jgi:hypothetical protein
MRASSLALRLTNRLRRPPSLGPRSPSRIVPLLGEAGAARISIAVAGSNNPAAAAMPLVVARAVSRLAIKELTAASRRR